jgi:hypothetical protein
MNGFCLRPNSMKHNSTFISADLPTRSDGRTFSSTSRECDRRNGHRFGRAGPGAEAQTLLHKLSVAALALFVFLISGCATSESGSRPPRPGARLAEYRQLVVDLRKAALASRQSAEALTSAPESKSAAAHARFDEAVQRLEVVSMRVRARADAMEKRGEAYFDEWAEEIKSEAGDAAKERFAELRQHFDEILKGSRQVRQAFRQFLDGLRGVTSSLGQHPVPAAIEKARPTLTKIVSDGKQAEETMDQLLNTLSAAQTAVMSGPMPPPKPEGKP